MLIGHSSAAERRAAECSYFNLRQLTRREHAHWTFLYSRLENITVQNACQSERLHPRTTRPRYYLCKKSDGCTEDTKKLV